MGVKIDEFDNPVCSSFKAKILNNALCYEVDLENYKIHDKLEKQLKLGLVFFMDYNEDKQLIMDESVEGAEGDVSRGEIIDGSNEDENAFIYLDTIGEH